MKKIDWYILRTFMVSFFFVLLLFTVIGIVIDVSEKTDDFVKSGLNTSQIITQYYFGFVPRIGAMLFPLWVFIAAIFFTSKMAGRSEVIAILAYVPVAPAITVFSGPILLAEFYWPSHYGLCNVR